MKPTSLYVHIPFCHHICAYCDFAKVYYHAKWADDYLEVLQKELADRQANRPFETVFIGGGSPSALNEKQLEKLLQILALPLDNPKEATIEVNPEDMTFEKAELLAKAKIDRVSIGVQTFDATILKELGRHHTLQDVEKTVEMLVAVGIQRISFDLIYGLPHQSLSHLQKDLEIIKRFPMVTHISFYNLILEEHTRFAKEGVTLPDEKWLLEAQKIIVEGLARQGFKRYEVSNYAKEGQASLHNQVYWHNERYIGIGCGASGYIDQIRYDNTKSLSYYLKGKILAQETRLEIEDEIFEHLMLGLRLCKGISLKGFELRYNQDVFEIYGEKLSQYIRLGYLELVDDYLRTTPLGMDILDEMLLGLMDE